MVTNYVNGTCTMCLLCVAHVSQCATCGAYGATLDYVVCVVQGEQSVSMWCLLHNLCCVLGSLKGWTDQLNNYIDSTNSNTYGVIKLLSYVEYHVGMVRWHGPPNYTNKHYVENPWGSE